MIPTCPRCGSVDVYSSRTRGALEAVLRAVGFPPRRCGACGWRAHRPRVLFPAKRGSRSDIPAVTADGPIPMPKLPPRQDPPPRPSSLPSAALAAPAAAVAVAVTAPVLPEPAVAPPEPPRPEPVTLGPVPPLDAGIAPSAQRRRSRRSSRSSRSSGSPGSDDFKDPFKGHRDPRKHKIKTRTRVARIIVFGLFMGLATGYLAHACAGEPLPVIEE